MSPYIGYVTTGISSLHFPGEDALEIMAMSRTVLYRVPTERCALLINQNRLWPEAFRWMSWLYRVRESKDMQLVGATSYSQVCASLHIMADWAPELRPRVGVLNYINHRTHISRTVISEMLSALRRGSTSP